MTFEEQLNSIPDIQPHLNSDLSAFTTFRLQSHGDLIIVKTLEALASLLKILHQHKRKYRLIGWGANQVLATIEKDVLIKLDLPFNLDKLTQLSEVYELPASVGLNHLTSAASKLNLSGWEVFTGVPASLGGAIAMNAGTALGEIGSLVVSVDVMTRMGEIKTIKINANSFSYRRNHILEEGDIIVSAQLRHLGVNPNIAQKIKDYLNYRKTTQPLATKNCGCVFKNFNDIYKAGKFIDLTGLKGLSVGALSVSQVHANFMENKGKANYEEFFELTRLINQQMQLHWGIEFELEVKAV